MDINKLESNYDILKSIYNDLVIDRTKLNHKISENTDKIKEINLYLESLFEKEDIEYEVFSPRNIQSVYKDKIESQNSEKETLLKENNILIRKINLINEKLEKLDIVLKNMSDTESPKEHFHLISDLSNCESVNDVSYLILELQEKERQRIARDLHDNAVQNLTHLIHKIELSSKFIDQDTVRAKMELLDISRNIRLIINDMRDIIFNLRPMEFDDLSLKATFDKFFTEIQCQTKINITCYIEEIQIYDQLSCISIFHIVKECVNNAIKYSKATNLNINIKEVEKNIKIIIKDDGIGFDTSKIIDKRHFGLSLIRNNVSVLKGKIDINSIIGEGTIIDISIPSCYNEGSIK